MKDPLFRFLERECQVLSVLLQTVRKDFKLVHELCTAERKSTNYIKEVAENLHADVVPKHWRKYVVAASTTASAWLHDFKNRVEQLQRLSESGDHGRSGTWFGGLLAPEAFLIATQQAAAQLNQWSLEDSELKFEFDPTEEDVGKAVEDQQGFVITGLAIESAEFDYDSKRIKMAAKLSSPLPHVLIRWARRGDSAVEGEQVDLPVYLNRSRRQLLCSITVPTYGVPAHSWYQRGVALFATDT